MRFGILLLCLMVIACGKKVKVSQTYEAREDQPNPEYSYGSNLEFQSQDEAKLGEAKAAICDQDYPTASRELQQLYGNVSTKREVREEAGLRWLQFGASFRNFSKEEKFIADDFSLPLELKFGMRAFVLNRLINRCNIKGYLPYQA